jgi:hypothetical protein
MKAIRRASDAEMVSVLAAAEGNLEVSRFLRIWLLEMASGERVRTMPRIGRYEPGSRHQSKLRRPGERGDH